MSSKVGAGSPDSKKDGEGGRRNSYPHETDHPELRDPKRRSGSVGGPRPTILVSLDNYYPTIASISLKGVCIAIGGMELLIGLFNTIVVSGCLHYAQMEERAPKHENGTMQMTNGTIRDHDKYISWEQGLLYTKGHAFSFVYDLPVLGRLEDKHMMADNQNFHLMIGCLLLEVFRILIAATLLPGTIWEHMRFSKYGQWAYLFATPGRIITSFLLIPDCLLILIVESIGLIVVFNFLGREWKPAQTVRHSVIIPGGEEAGMPKPNAGRNSGAGAGPSANANQKDPA